MAIFLRGNVWWMEYRTRKVRKVVTTGFKKADKAKAEAAFAAFRLGMGARPKRSAMEGVLSAIYDGQDKVAGIPLASVWAIYEDWFKGKARVVSPHTYANHRGVVARFVAWGEKRGVLDISDVSVAVAREYVKSLSVGNKSKRAACQQLSATWNAVGQLMPGIHNPWQAATPDNDGSSVRHEVFSPAQVAAILEAARKVGHGWWLASMIAMHTGLRYGDVACMSWDQVDLAHGTIDVVPSKTRRSSGVHLLLPISSALMDPLVDAASRCGGTGYVLPEQALRYPKPISEPFSSVLEQAGLKGRQWGFHCWRHTAATRLAEAGVPVETRQMICGWTNYAMAKHYDHASHLPEMREAVEKMAAVKSR